MNYEQLNKLLGEQNVLVDGAEIHGLICGMLAGGMALSDQSWKEAISDVANQGDGFAPELADAIEEVFNQVCQQLIDSEFALEMLLPDDQAPINDRGLALIGWVQGFMTGFGFHQQDLTKCSEDVKEALEDFADIARMEEPMDEDEESEKALFEVIEYVRVSAMLCFNELGQSLIEDQKDKPSIH